MSDKSDTPLTDAQIFWAKQDDSVRTDSVQCVDPDFARQLERQLSAQSAELAAAREGWQPIETAPKDGTEILLTDGCLLAVARWDWESWPHADRGNACWSISDWHNDPIHLRGGYMATHWQHLPDAALKG